MRDLSAAPRRPLRTGTKRPRRTYRTEHQAVVGWLGAAAMVALGTGISLGPAPSSRGGYEIVAVAILIAIGCARFARCGVYVSAGGVRVRNVLRTTDLAWGQIKEFRLAAAGPCQIALQDGKWISITGIQQTNLQWMTRRQDTPASRMIADLNDVLREHAGTH